MDRTTASATYHRLVRNSGFWSVTGAWGRNTEEDHATNAVFLETYLGLDDRNTVFARIEGGEKTGEDLVIPELAEEIVGVSKLHIGYSRRLLGGTFEPRVGAAVSFSGIPNRVEQAYGREIGFGVTVLLSLRPRTMPGLPGMRRAATTGTAEPHGGHAGAAPAPPPTAAPRTPAPAAGSRPSSQAANFAVDPVDGLKVDPSTAPRDLSGPDVPLVLRTVPRTVPERPGKVPAEGVGTKAMSPWRSEILTRGLEDHVPGC